MQRLSFLFLSCFICLFLSGSFFVVQAQEKDSSNKKIDSASWIKVTPKDVGFSVLMPSAPKEIIDNLNYASIKVPTRLYVATIGEVNFFAGRMGDFPEQLVTAGYFNGLYDNMYRVFFEGKDKNGNKNMMPFTQRDISLSEFSGREYIADCGPYRKTDVPCNNTIRVYKVGDSIFVVGAAGPKSLLSVELTDKFFSSFTLTQ
jgi:hypothetical protein